MPTVDIPAPYTGPTHGADRVRVDGDTVRACLDAVEKRFPGFGPLVLDAAGKPHRFVRLFVNGKPAKPETSVRPDDTVGVLAGIAGGGEGAPRRGIRRKAL
jgi:molybdopterin converting factor small subunit